MLSPILLAALLGAVVNAAPGSPNNLPTSIFSTVTHVTRYKPANGVMAALSTKTRLVAKKVTSTVTQCAGASTITTTIVPDAVTSTLYGYNTTQAPPDLASRADEPCATTTTVSASVATVFTGQYNRTIAARTASPLDRRSPALRPGLLGQIVHRLGTNALVNQNPYEVDCYQKETTYFLTTTTAERLPVTETVVAATPIVYVTQQEKHQDLLGSNTTTVTGASAANSSTAGGVCTVTASASSTTTQHLKCAPTNLISEVDGYGIGQTQGDESNTRGLAPGSDPSACCQLCVDTEDCAASEDDPDAGNCFLWYTEPTCGLGFKYSTNNQKLAPGTGFIVQTGCGSIEATEPPTFD